MLAIAGLLLIFFIGKYIIWEFILHRIIRLCFNSKNNTSSKHSDLHVLEGIILFKIIIFKHYQ